MEWYYGRLSALDQVDRDVRPVTPGENKYDMPSIQLKGSGADGPKPNRVRSKIAIPDEGNAKKLKAGDRVTIRVQFLQPADAKDDGQARFSQVLLPVPK